MTEHKPIEFYFEFASPYGYFASTKIDSIAEKYGRTVNWKPIMLGAALQATGIETILYTKMSRAQSRTNPIADKSLGLSLMSLASTAGH